MLAEAFDEEVKIFYQSVESKHNSQFQLELLELYGRFIQRNYGFYEKGNFHIPVNSAFAKEQRELGFRYILKDHQLLALKVLFTEEQVTLSKQHGKIFFKRRTNLELGQCK